MHSDESWLSGLTRAIMSGGFQSTEPFFDLVPRNPHAIKSLFHILQMPFILIFGYNLYAVRLLSLIFSMVALLCFYHLAKLLLNNETSALIATIILSIDIQFVYTSHLARQEIIILAGMLGIMYVVVKSIEQWSCQKDLMVGILVGLLIGIHPNSFIVALVIGSLYLYYYVIEHKMTFKNILVLLITVSLFASFFVGLSFLLDPEFVSHYTTYGSTLGVDQSLPNRIKSLGQYFEKLYLQISGTYYLPWIKLQMIVFALAIITSVVLVWKKRELLKILGPIIAILLGLFIIGRYSQPAVVFFFPLSYLLLFMLARYVKIRAGFVLAVMMGLGVLTSSLLSFFPGTNDDYKDYLQNIQATVPKDSKVLANLNAEYAFDEGALLDYRNLDYLYDKGMTFEDYIERHEIEYIVYPEEMGVIYKRRPVWNIMYGNLYPYYDDMQAFLKEDCELLAEFTSPYAMRIVIFAGQEDWTVRIYKLKLRENHERSIQ